MKEIIVGNKAIVNTDIMSILYEIRFGIEIVVEHCKQDCCLTERDGCICVLHRTHSVYCFFRHLLYKTDSTNCLACSYLSQ